MWQTVLKHARGVVFAIWSILGISPLSAQEMFIGYGAGEIGFRNELLSDLFETFFERPPTRADLDILIRDFSGRGRDRAGDPTRLRQITVGVRHDWPLGPALRTRSELALSVGTPKAQMRNGFGIFRDPATLSVDYRLLTASQVIEAPLLRHDGLSLSGAAGLGLQYYHADMRLRSALLDVSSQISGTRRFLSLGLSANFTDAPWGMDLTYRRFDNGAETIGLRGRLSF